MRGPQTHGWAEFRTQRLDEKRDCSPFSLQDPTPAATPETPPVISAVVHATDEEKLAVTNQKWTCMTVDLESDKQDYPQPSDLSTFVNETKFSSPTEGKRLGGQPDPHPALETTAPSEQKARKGTSKPGNGAISCRLSVSHALRLYLEIA